MAKNRSSLNTKALYQRIRSSISEADRICGNWDYINGAPTDEDKEQIEVNLESAFEQSLVLMERMQLPEARLRVDKLYEKAKKNLADTKYSASMGEPYLIWSYKLSQVLGGVEHPDTIPLEALEIIRGICDGFHKTALSLGRNRHNGRQTLLMQDEYDVQYLIGALLSGAFSDVRTEEYTPSYAGKSSRMDFLLNDESIVVEVKMTRQALKDKDVSDQLIIDKERYRTHPKCRTLICFVYDSQSMLKNPTALETDLSSDDEELSVHVWIKPNR
jgi:hypothetical protein